MKVYYSINELTGRVNFYQSGKFLLSKKLSFWYDEEGELRDNLTYILDSVKKMYNVQMVESKMNYRSKIKKHFGCFPYKMENKISKIKEQFVLIKQIALFVFKRKKERENFEYYMKSWVISYNNDWIGYVGGWSKEFGCSNSYKGAIENGLKTIDMLPSYVVRIIKKFKISPTEKHHMEINNNKVVLISFFCPNDLLNIINNIKHNKQKVSYDYEHIEKN